MKILIIEDENAAARRLEKLIREALDQVEIVSVIDSVERAVLYLREHPQPDLILLDIHLSDGSSFEIFDHVQVSCPIIFTTAYDEYAIQAFKFKTVDYLLKPIKPAELQAAIEKYKNTYKNIAQSIDYQSVVGDIRPDPKSRYLRRMLIRFGSSFKLVDMEDAAYFYSKDKITFVVVKQTGKRFPVDYPLDKLETLLDPALFYRINRQFMVHINAIKEMHTHSKSRVKVELDPPSDLESVVSTERSSDFKRWLTGE